MEQSILCCVQKILSLTHVIMTSVVVNR